MPELLDMPDQEDNQAAPMRRRPSQACRAGLATLLAGALCCTLSLPTQALETYAAGDYVVAVWQAIDGLLPDGGLNETSVSPPLAALTPWYGTPWVYLLGGLLVAALVVGIYEARLHRLRRARALQADFSRRLIDSQETERKRMAKELHDGLGQNLILIKNRAELGLKHLNTAGLPAEQLIEISKLASTSIEDVRATARALHPPELERLGLANALDAMAQRAARTTPTVFHTDIEDVNHLFKPDVQTNLYRILQEGVSNVLKHAQAREVILEIKRENDFLRATLLDDGCGFDLASLTVNTREGLGLQSIAERASLMGGNLSIQSAPGRGTRIDVTVPLEVSVHG